MKTPIDVLALMPQSGSMRPVLIRWDDGREFPIDKVLSVTPNGRLMPDIPVRYVVVIAGQQRELLLQDGRWFVVG